MSQYQEELFEEGIVESVNKGIAEVFVNRADCCEECSAKIYCKPKNSEVRKLLVRESLNVEPGDKVRIAIKGRNLLSASIYIYGFPLIILISIILTGMIIFQNNPELYSFLCALFGLGIYFLILRNFAERLSRRADVMPEIIMVFKERLQK